MAFSAQIRVSGIGHSDRSIRKGAVDAVLKLDAHPEAVVADLRKIAASGTIQPDPERTPC